MALPTQEALDAYRWYIYFTSQQFYILLLSLIVFLKFRHSRDAAIATAVLVKSIYATIGEFLGLQDKYASFEIIWQVLIFGLILHSLYRYITNARKSRDI